MLLGEGIINMLDVISNDACPNRRGGWRCFKSKYIDELHLHKTLWMKYNIYRLVGVRKCCFRMGKHILWFYGKVGELDFDLKCYFWKGDENFFSYSSTLEQKMLRDTKPKVNVVEKRWCEVLPLNFKLK
jgi:hypothetical protein